MRKYFRTIIIFVLLSALVRPVFAVDGRLLISTTPSAGGLQVSVRLEPAEPLNALEGSLRFDSRVLEVVSVNDAGSPMSLWLQRPVVTAPGRLSFAGAIPGGIGASGNGQVTLFSVLFRVRVSAKTELSLQDIKAYLNQPGAQPAVLSTNVARISVTAADTDVASLVREDTTPPQRFTPVLFKTVTPDGSKRFVAFSTTDKESGVAYSEIRERRFGLPSSWRRFESPAALEDQWGTSIVEVRAVDNAGNIRLARIIPISLWAVWITLLCVILGAGWKLLKLRTSL